MKKVLLCLGIAILCAGVPSVDSALGQQFPAESRGGNASETTRGMSNRELVELVTAQTNAIKALDQRLRELEGRVETLENDGER